MTLSYVNPGTPMIAQNTGLPGMVPGQTPQWGVPTMPAQQGYYSMPYAPVYGNQPSPSYSAVKIDINGATVDAGQGQSQIVPMYPGRAQMMAPMPQMPQPSLPSMSTAYPVGIPNMPIPQYIAPPQPIGLPQQTPQPMVQQLPPPIPQPMAPIPVPPQMITPQPVQQMPTVAPMPVQNTIPQPVQPQVQPAAVDQAQLQTEQASPEIQPLLQAIKTITPEQGQQPSATEQDQAIRTIAQYAEAFQAANEMIKTEPENPMAKEAKGKIDQLIKPVLMDETVFKGLAGIATSDTSSLSGDQKEQADQNKIISMWTLAILQKVFREEVNKELAKDNIPPMSLGEVPGVAQIVGNIKSDSNPRVREAGIVALMEVADKQNPKDVELMNIILNTAAEQDSSEDIKEVAQKSMEELEKA